MESTNDHAPDAVGVDISKAHLDAHRLSTGEAARFANDADGFEELASWVGHPAAPVVYESTGPWHRGLEESLAGRMRPARVHAVRARRFAQALGEDAKTDAVDARVLAAMGAAVALRIVEPRPAALRDLDELVAARDALVKDRTAALNRETRHVEHPPRPRPAAADEAASLPLARLARPRRGADQTAGSLAVDAAELRHVREQGRRDHRTDARDGRQHLVAARQFLVRSHGLGDLRAQGLDLPADQCKPALPQAPHHRVPRLLRHNPDMARRYAEMRDRGKPAKVALTAVMRKLAVLANALLKQDRLWTPEPARA